jgi:hypothetical protein
MVELDMKEIPRVYDEEDQLTLDRSVESLKEQIGLYEKSIKAIEGQREDYLAQCAVDEAAWAIRMAPGNHEKLDDKKAFKYELDPQYWVYVRAKMEYEVREMNLRKEGQLKSFEHRLDEMRSQKQITEDKLSALQS